MQNETLNELWEVKGRMAEEYNYDIEAMASSLRIMEIDGQRNQASQNDSKPDSLAQSNIG